MIDYVILAVDSSILLLLIGWSVMDRCNIYFREKP